MSTASAPPHEGLNPLCRPLRCGPSRREPSCLSLHSMSTAISASSSSTTRRSMPSTTGCARSWSRRWRRRAAMQRSKGVVLTCAGRTFIAGADISEFGQPPQSPTTPEVIEAIERMGKPVVAALFGTPMGGGLEVALGCHFRIAAAGHALGVARDQARPDARRRRHPAPAAACRHGEGAGDDPFGRSDHRRGRACVRIGRRDRGGRSPRPRPLRLHVG